MKKFKFTLQTVHNVREMRQERETVRLGELQSEAHKAEERVRHYENLRAEALANYTQRMNSGERLNPMELELNSNHFTSLNRLQQEAEGVVEEKRQACIRQIETVAAAMKEVKVTGTLRDTQRTIHDTNLAREEQSNLDEIVSANFSRQLMVSAK